jgi:hypothetical protein
VSSSDHASVPDALSIAMLCWMTRFTPAFWQAEIQIGVPSRRTRSFSS